LHQLLDKCEIIDYEGHFSVNMAALSINLWQVK
ncbi:glucosidase, partial [Vibrio parahaemolyticus]